MTKYIYIWLVAIIFCSSCVSTQKYNALLDNRNKLEKQKVDLEKNIAYNEELISSLRDKEVMLKETSQKLDELQYKYDVLNNAYNDLKDDNEMLLQQSEALVKSATEKRDELNDALMSREKELDVKDRELQFSMERLEKLNQELAKRDSILTQLKEKINNALLGFSQTDLSVYEKDGRVYVSMSQELLFASGSDVIDSKGLDAIEKLVPVLKVNPEIQILVEGHTDTDGAENFNWDLSVRRASAVVKKMIKEGLPGVRITASGRAFYHPLKANDTPENKAQNRRTEIILTPKLDELYSIIGS